MREQGCAFTGLLYAGLMLTKQGPKVVEFNCRFGDPETQALLPLMASSLLSPMRAIAEGHSLADAAPLAWKPGASVSTVVAAAGYPGTIATGDAITLPDDSDEVIVFHAGTKRLADDTLVTSGGRVVAVTAIAADIRAAQQASAAAAAQVKFEGAAVPHATSAGANSRAIRKRGPRAADAPHDDACPNSPRPRPSHVTWTAPSAAPSCVRSRCCAPMCCGRAPRRRHSAGSAARPSPRYGGGRRAS
jgi:hypothetical protein